MPKWTVWGLDVWGNPKDGYDVNDRRDAGRIELPDDCDERDVITALKLHGLINPRVRAESIGVDFMDTDVININDNRTAAAGKPVYTLERDNA